MPMRYLILIHKSIVCFIFILALFILRCKNITRVAKRGSGGLQVVQGTEGWLRGGLVVFQVVQGTEDKECVWIAVYLSISILFID